MELCKLALWSSGEKLGSANLGIISTWMASKRSTRDSYGQRREESWGQVLQLRSDEKASFNWNGTS